MALELLHDCFNCGVGAVPIARVTAFSRPVSRPPISTRGDAVDGEYTIDGGPYHLSAKISAQDPLIVPTVAGLVGQPVQVEAAGRVADIANTWRKLGIAHGVLTGAALSIVDQQAGSCTLDFVNRATQTDETQLALEAIGAAASAPAVVTRATTIRVLGSLSTFTPYGGSALAMDGLDSLNWSARPIKQTANAVNGSDFVNSVDVLGWAISGSITTTNRSLANGLSFTDYLLTLPRGDLSVVCRVSGRSEQSARPANVVLTIKNIDFKDTSPTLNSKSESATSINFDGLMRLGTATMTLNQVILAA